MRLFSVIGRRAWILGALVGVSRVRSACSLRVRERFSSTSVTARWRA